MEKRTKILIGLGLIGLTYYLIKTKAITFSITRKEDDKKQTPTIEKESGFIPCKGKDGVVRNVLTLPIGTKCY